MTHDRPLREDQMTNLMEHAMLPVTASEELVAGSVGRGRSMTRRRRATQAVGIGAAAALATFAVVAAPSVLGGPDDERSSVAGDPAGGASTAAGPTADPTSPSAPDALPPHLQRAQDLLLDALPDPVPDPGAMVRVDYDPDGRGLGEILAVVTTGGDDITGSQPARCDRVAASTAPDDCVDTGDGWVFTDASLPDVSGKDPDLAGLQAVYILRDTRIVNLTAYNAPEPARGGRPTRPDPVLDADELVELVTTTAWFD